MYRSVQMCDVNENILSNFPRSLKAKSRRILTGGENIWYSGYCILYILLHRHFSIVISYCNTLGYSL